ncbi:hypothetical protein JHK82_024662 [Glycine max]|nr:hypothetical protein JHK86_024765 [Glycine max]KAG5133474.1 hypothetical protein JHK82_024662 [Glycine max]
MNLSVTNFDEDMNHAQPPTKPRDRGDGGSQVKVSFRDETMWEQVFKKREIRDLIAQKKFCVEYEHGDRLKPKCFEDDFILKELLDPWKEAVNHLVGYNGNNGNNDMSSHKDSGFLSRLYGHTSTKCPSMVVVELVAQATTTLVEAGCNALKFHQLYIDV